MNAEQDHYNYMKEIEYDAESGRYIRWIKTGYNTYTAVVIEHPSSL